MLVKYLEAEPAGDGLRYDGARGFGVKATRCRIFGFAAVGLIEFGRFRFGGRFR